MVVGACGSSQVFSSARGLTDVDSCLFAGVPCERFNMPSPAAAVHVYAINLAPPLHWEE